MTLEPEQGDQPPEWEMVFDGDPIEATVARAALDAAGFTVAGLGQTNEFPGLDFDEGRVFVPADQAEAARTLIEQAQQNR